MGNFIKIDRKILQWEWYKNEHTKNVFFHCLLKAYWKDKKIEGKIIPRGSFVSSIGKIAEELDLTPMEVRTALKHLKLTNEVTSKGTNRNTVFTVTNYDLYQAKEQSDEQTDNEQTTIKEQTDNEQTTIKEQTINNPLTTNEESKEDNREEGKERESERMKEDTPPISPSQGEQEETQKRKRFIPPTVEEVRIYCNERGNSVNPEQFVDFYESKGWYVGKNKMKDWKAAVRTWERERNQKKSTRNMSGDINASRQSQLDYLLNSIKEAEQNE